MPGSDTSLLSASLRPHVSCAPGAVLGIDAQLSWRRDKLHVGYRLRGAVPDLRLDLFGPTGRADELWRSTCFEAFLRPSESGAYAEYNFTPGKRWAAYAFDWYRAGMRDLDAEPLIECAWSGDELDLHVTLDVPDYARDPACRVNLTAVIEETSGAKSYWALAHPFEGPPDFHHPSGFLFELPPPPLRPSSRT